MFGKLNETGIEELIHHQLIGRVGCHADGITYVVPLSYAYDGTYIYGHTFEGMKVQMLRKNPSICFEVDNTINLANWQSVIGWGTYEELPGGPERDDAVQKLQNRVLPVLSSETMHLSPQWPFPSGSGSEIQGIIFRIRLTDKTGRFEKEEEKYFYST